MLTYSQLEAALEKIGYSTDLKLRHHTKLIATIPMQGYQSAAVLEFREGWSSELGNVEQLLQIEWLMEDGENSLFLDVNSLDEIDEDPSVFVNEKILLRQVFDQILEAIASIIED
ncbi:hypothetical protein HCU40_17025 [Pseudanabaena biceps]|nr:hypothetical protein [Pseudanabaena biceps]